MAACTSAGGKVPTTFPDPNVEMFSAPDADDLFADDDLSGAAEDAEEGNQ